MAGVSMTFFGHELSIDVPVAVEMRAESMADVAGTAMGGRFTSAPGKTHTVTEFLDYYSADDVDVDQFDLGLAMAGCRTKKDWYAPPDIMGNTVGGKIIKSKRQWGQSKAPVANTTAEAKRDRMRANAAYAVPAAGFNATEVMSQIQSGTHISQFNVTVNSTSGAKGAVITGRKLLAAVGAETGAVTGAVTWDVTGDVTAADAAAAAAAVAAAAAGDLEYREAELEVVTAVAHRQLLALPSNVFTFKGCYADKSNRDLPSGYFSGGAVHVEPGFSQLTPRLLSGTLSSL